MSVYDQPKYFLVAFAVVTFAIFALTSFFAHSGNKMFSGISRNGLNLNNNYYDNKTTFVLNNQTTLIFHSKNFNKNLVRELKIEFNNVYKTINAAFSGKIIRPKIKYNI